MLFQPVCGLGQSTCHKAHQCLLPWCWSCSGKRGRTRGLAIQSSGLGDPEAAFLAKLRAQRVGSPWKCTVFCTKVRGLIWKYRLGYHRTKGDMSYTFLYVLGEGWSEHLILFIQRQAVQAPRGTHPPWDTEPHQEVPYQEGNSSPNPRDRVAKAEGGVLSPCQSCSFLSPTPNPPLSSHTFSPFPTGYCRFQSQCKIFRRTVGSSYPVSYLSNVMGKVFQVIYWVILG